MNFYPYSTPIILTDDIFISYGGEVRTTNKTNRQNAYTIAEQRVSEHLNTFLLPTIVTGTYVYNPIRTVITDHSYIHRILSVLVRARQNDSTCSFTDTSECAYIRDDTYGIVDVRMTTWGSCGCGTYLSPYQIRLVYESGLPTGVANHPNVLQALTIMANITLSEMFPLESSNESPGDIGVQSFRNQGYSEERVKLVKTGLGSSPRAIYVSQLLRGYRKRKYAGL